uniref:Uncharacterized protein n=1 Tax=Anguilla anguilla TaxID=7936 RepID=A0A0E9UFY0_ANGAN
MNHFKINLKLCALCFNTGVLNPIQKELDLAVSFCSNQSFTHQL